MRQIRNGRCKSILCAAACERWRRQDGTKDTQKEQLHARRSEVPFRPMGENHVSFHGWVSVITNSWLGIYGEEITPFCWLRLDFCRYLSQKLWVIRHKLQTLETWKRYRTKFEERQYSIGDCLVSVTREMVLVVAANVDMLSVISNNQNDYKPPEATVLRQTFDSYWPRPK